MVNYACAFSQSELGKYFEWIMIKIHSCLACVYHVMDARLKFGQHERSVRVAQDVAESNPSFLSALQTFQVHRSWQKCLLFWLNANSHATHCTKETNVYIAWLQTHHDRLVWMNICFQKIRVKFCLFIR